MERIALIACSSKKKHDATEVRYLYDSPLFKLSLQYVDQLEPDEVFVLSAKHGLLSLDEVIEPYNVTLDDMSPSEVRAWADDVIGQLEVETNTREDHFIILAGLTYRKHLVPHLHSYEVPLEGLWIGKQLQYLKQLTAK